MSPKSLFVPALAAATLLSGCTFLGPSSIKATRPAYNLAIQQTNDQELLLNLVRIHYRDTLYFTTVERIAATQELLEGVSASGGISQTQNNYSIPPIASTAIRSATKPFTLGPANISINEKPTIFYAPVQGDVFVRQMMQPMKAELLLLLVQSGWSLDRVFTVGVAEMNGLKNAPTASGPTPSRAPVFEQFRTAVKNLRALQREGLLNIVEAAGDKGGVDMLFSPEAADRPETKILKEMLHLNPAKDRFKIVLSTNSASGDTIALSTRPVLSALNYLSQGVDSPEKDIKAGKLRATTTDGTTPFDWQNLLGEVFHIRASEKAPSPDETSTAIHYRGSWFYIADNDLDTKATFVLLTQLIGLHSVAASGAPAISISK
jgi:hypothetical protein